MGGICGTYVGGERFLRRLEDNIKMDLREIKVNEANWIWLAQDGVRW
jgi:hypothetical protein